MPCSILNIKAVSTHQNLMDLVEGYVEIKLKEFESNVASIKKVEPDTLPEKFEVVELRQKVKC